MTDFVLNLFSLEARRLAAAVFFSAAVAGLIGLYTRLLYRRFARSVANRDRFSAVFVPLTITVVIVIACIKSSLALSLGLVGALSIVRFRAAIKEPEELIYLFFCIAMGLALGAAQLLIAAVGVFVFTVFVVIAHRQATRRAQHHLLLTVSGREEAILGQEAGIEALLAQHVEGYEVQRLECDGGFAQFRAAVRFGEQNRISAVVQALRARLPECQVSYVNLDSVT